MQDVAKVAEPELADAQKVADLINRTTIHNDEEMRVAVAWTAEVKEKFEVVDTKRKGFVNPLRGVIEEINVFFKPILDSLKTAEAALKTKVSTYVETTLAKRDEVIASVHTISDAGQRFLAVQQAEALVPAKVEGMSIRETWTGKITDMRKVVEWAIGTKRWELLAADETMLKAWTKALGQDPQIPGWEAFVQRTVAISTAKVKR
jgi:GTP:adenosylcobinamide-phosphate guanylyltransferase